ncbi:hypothetical protein HPB52_004971 [Rhipicephalus sanguineus]|uniref:DDE-1 domain-containing protein n=1 Tax=Rhipicephalus sanguineus TaxID=34632 RepID=A0A9D4SRZ0_RHISA|nr:hypothetical protein HPB52_004971 [Rhipicephalus sanguineus]
MLYRFNTKAWMTSKLFEEYMRLLDHNLSAVKPEFLAANTMALSQPLDDQGIIRSFVVPAQPTSPSEAYATEDDDSECEALIAEVLERQGGGNKVPASDGDEEEDDDNNAEPEDVSCPSVAEAARALDVMRVFAEKNGLMDKLAIHLDGFEAAVVAARPQSGKREPEGLTGLAPGRAPQHNAPVCLWQAVKYVSDSAADCSDDAHQQRPVPWTL